MKRSILALGLVLTRATPTFSQPSPAFEVVSIKVGKAGDPHPNGVSGDRFSLGPMPLAGLIRYAYNLRTYEVVGGPDLFGSENYIIDAKAPGDGSLSLDQARLMLRAALVDRFQLQLHKETRDSPVYDLTIARGGVRFKDSTAQDSGLQFTASRIKAAKISTVQLATLLSNATGRPVLDKTGLAGNYELDLKFTPLADFPPDSPDAQFAAKADAPSIFIAIQEQLGLKLEPAKSSMEVLVIDAWRKPSEN